MNKFVKVVRTISIFENKQKFQKTVLKLLVYYNSTLTANFKLTTGLICFNKFQTNITVDISKRSGVKLKLKQQSNQRKRNIKTLQSNSAF